MAHQPQSHVSLLAHAGPPANLRVAIVHDWLVTYAGSERVVEHLLQAFPQADVFSLIDFLPNTQRQFLGGRKVHTSFLQRMPLVAKHYPRYLPLMPLAIEQFDLSSYDLVLSSSHCVAKGIITGPHQLHVSYVHTPIRYAWDLQHQYLAASGLARGLKSWLARWMLHRLRQWDVRTSNGVDAFAANSQFIAGRIWKAYRRESRVIYPPVDVDRFKLQEAKEDFYLTASRLVPYKRVDVLVEAFAQMPEKRLVVIGDGSEASRLRRLAPSNVTLLGQQSADVLCQYMQRARAFLFASQEDFGIVLVEAQACGTPVIALAQGGALETVRGLDQPQPTGVFFDQQSARSVVEAVETFENNCHQLKAGDCRNNALRFDWRGFQKEILEFVRAEWAYSTAARSGRHRQSGAGTTQSPPLEPPARRAA